MKNFFKKLGAIVGIFLLIIILFAGINTFIYGNRPHNMRTGLVMGNPDTRKLVIDQDVPVKFKKGKRFEIKYHINKDQIPKVKNKNGTLKITSLRHAGWRTFLKFIRFGGDDDNESITIMVPRHDNQLSTLDSDQGASDLDLSNVHLKNIRLTTGAGDMHLSHLRARYLMIKTDAGDVHLSKSKVKNIRILTGAGDIHLSHVKAGKLVHHTGAGDVDTRDVGIYHESN